MEKIKRITSILLVAIIIAAQANTFFVMGSDVEIEKDYLTIQTKNRQLNNGKTTILGKSLVVEELGDLKDAIMMIMYMKENTSYNEFSFSNTTYDSAENIYSKNNANFYCNEVVLDGMVIAENNINVYSTIFKNNENNIIYTKNGDINIGVNQMDYQGIIYAPNGTVTINASTVNFSGIIVCEKLITNTGEFRCVGNEICQNLYNLFVKVTNDTMLEAEITVDEGVFSASYECNKLIEKIDVYARVNDSLEYEFYMELPENGEFTFDKEFETLDIALKGCTVLGESVKSNVLSYDVYNDDIEYYYCDADEDGFSDGEEIWLLGTNPESVDTDGDGFSDYYEAIVLCSNPAEYTEDADYDKDGLTNIEEMEIGTNPLLKDSDLDGLIDNTDENQYYYNVGASDINYDEYLVAVGILDKVITSFTDDMKMVQSVYNPITKMTKQYVAGDVVSKIFVNDEGQKIGELVKVADNYRVNTFSYDENNKITQLTNNGDIYDYKYLEDGGVKQVNVNGKTMLWYDEEIGRLNYSNGDSYATNYDEETLNVGVELNDTVIMEYVEGQYGEVLDFTNNISDISCQYEYYETGYVKSLINNKGFSSMYTYNDDGVEITYYDDNNQYQQYNNYDKDNTVNVSLISGDILEKYDIEQKLGYSIENDSEVVLNTEYEYENDKLVKITYVDGSYYEYEYNVNSQITKICENGEIIKEYVYYTNGQLSKETDYISGETKAYYYDCYNNLLKVTTYTEDGQKSECSYEYNSELWNDVLSSYNNSGIEYDEFGNPVKYYDGATFEWNGRELSSACRNGNNIQYAYNYNGIRNYKNVNGVETFYFIEGKDIVAEKTGDDIIWYIYDDNNEIFGFILNGSTYYYNKNATNDVIGIVDGNGNEVCKYTYDAWGNVSRIEGNEYIASVNPIRYRSYYYDKDLDMYYLETRFYDSNVRRFINPDNMLRVNCNDMDYNLYAYCGGDPVNLYDPTGQATTYIGLFTVSEYKGESNSLRNQLHSALGTATSWRYKMGDDYASFKEWWNNLGYRDLVIINTHGEPITFLSEDNGLAILTNVKVADWLEKQQVKLLVLLGCNCGHFDYKKSIARAFANKITGKVVASDGTVITNSGDNYTNLWYESVCDSKFRGLYVNEYLRPNYGWLVYVGTNVTQYSARIYYMGGTGYMELTVGTIANFIKYPAFYNAFK